MPLTSLDGLPVELYEAILNQVSAEDSPKTILALTRAIPYAPVPVKQLFTSIRLHSRDAIVALDRRLRRDTIVRTYVRELILESLDADPEVVINLLSIVIHVTSLTLLVGPTYYPAHLDRILEQRRSGLEHLTLRFKPYLQRVNYYRFHAGIYFDTAISTLSKWPKSTLKTLAISQDPPLRAAEPTQQFAQPLVFFSLEPFSALSISVLSKKVTRLQIKLPARNIFPLMAKFEDSFPDVTLLDISTCLIRQPDVEKLLVKLTDVHHLILDGCDLIRGINPDEEEWFALGRMLALIGTKRARDREKQLKRDLEDMATRRAEKEARIRTQEAGPSSVHTAGHQAPEAAADVRKRKVGRRGIANATISIRKPSPPPVSRNRAPPIAQPGQPGRVEQSIIQRIRVMPPPPTILSLSTTNHTTKDPEHHKQIREEFQKGWESGLDVLKATWLRLRMSQVNGGVRLMGFEPRETSSTGSFATRRHKHTRREGKLDPDLDSSDSDSSESSTSVDLDDLTRGLQDHFAGETADFSSACPILCFGGSDPNAEHPPECGHSYCPASWKQRDVSIVME